MNNGTNDNNIPLESYIISLADRIDIQIKRNVLNQIDEIVKVRNDKRNEKIYARTSRCFLTFFHETNLLHIQ